MGLAQSTEESPIFGHKSLDFFAGVWDTISWAGSPAGLSHVLRGDSFSLQE